MRKIFLFIVLIVSLGCKTQQISITNTEWKLVKMYDEDLSALTPPLTLTLDEAQKKISGFAGCNRFFGGYELNQSTLKFGNTGSTKMFCQDKSEIESNYFKALGEVQSFKSENEKLFLLSGEKIILEFKK
jgi:heat shock protein HslJ